MVTECKKYEIYRRHDLIGEFIESYDDLKGLQTSITLKEVPLVPLSLKLLAAGNQLDHKSTMQWIENRVIPKTQDGCMEKLNKIGIYEYDAYTIFKHFNGFNTKDRTWVKFKPLNPDVEKYLF